MFNLTNLTGCYLFGADGSFRSCDPDPESVARAILGGEDARMLDHENTPSGRTIAFDPYADRDRPLNPLGSQFLGRPVHGTIVVLPRSS